MKRTMHVCLGTLSSLLPLGSCAPDSAAEAGYVVRDSAGIRIIENLAPAWTDAEAWRLSSSPTLELGLQSGAPEAGLYGVRSAVRLGNGHYVVANGGNHELRWYDAEGQFVQQAGREGGGPGEFASLGGVMLLGSDSVVAWDRRNLSVMTFASNAEYVHSVPMGMYADVRGMFDDGSLLLGQIVRTPGDGFLRHKIVVRRFNRASGATDSLAVLAGPDEMVAFVSRNGRNLMLTGPPPFGRMGVLAVRAGGFLASNQDAYAIRIYTADGTLQSIVRLNRPGAPVTAGDIAALEGAALENADVSMRSELRRLFAERDYPDMFPAHGTILVDPRDNVWIQEYPKPGEPDVEWFVFDRESRWLGAVTFPSDLEVYEVGADYVLGKWRDELDIEHVGVYDLLKP